MGVQVPSGQTSAGIVSGVVAVAACYVCYKRVFIEAASKEMTRLVDLQKKDGERVVKRYKKKAARNLAVDYPGVKEQDEKTRKEEHLHWLKRLQEESKGVLRLASLKSKGASPSKRSEEADFAMSYELEMQDAMDMDKVCLPLSPWEKLQIDRCFNHFDRDHSHELDLEEGTQPHSATLHLFCACNARARAPPSQPAT